MALSVDLAESYLFKGLPAKVVEPLKGICQTRQYEAGAIIFDEGEPAKLICILKSGKVELSFSLPQQMDTTQIRITEIHPGEIFGWSALVEDNTWTARATAIHDSEAILIPGTGLKKLMDSDPGLGYPVMEQMLQLVVSRLHDTRHQLRWLLRTTP